MALELLPSVCSLIDIFSESQCIVINKGVVTCIGLADEFRSSTFFLTLELEVFQVLLLESFVL